MKKLVIAVTVLVLAAAGSLGAFIAVKNKNDKEVKKQQEVLDDNVIFTIDSDNINKVEIKNSDGFFSIGLVDDEWILTESDNGSFPVEESKMTSICNYISNLVADTNYEEITEDKKAVYGLDDPYTITVSDGSDEYTLYIGDISATGDYYYATAEGKNNIYGISSTSAEAILAQKFDIISANLTSYGDNTIKGMKLIKDGKVVYDLNYDDDERYWKLPEKYSMLTLNNSRVAQMVTILARVEHQGMISTDPAVKSEYGFDKPYAEFIITGDDGKTESFLFSKENTESSTYINVFFEDAGFTEKYYTADLKLISYDLFDLVEHSIEGASMYKISGFDIECERGSDSFTLDNDTGIAECRGTEIDLNNSELYSFFNTFYNTFAYTSITSIDVDAKPELENPVFKATYSFPDGETSEICMVESENNEECYVFFNGEYTGTLAKTDFFGTMIESYNLLCSHAGIEPVME